MNKEEEEEKGRPGIFEVTSLSPVIQRELTGSPSPPPPQRPSGSHLGSPAQMDIEFYACAVSARRARQGGDLSLSHTHTLFLSPSLSPPLSLSLWENPGSGRRRSPSSASFSSSSSSLLLPTQRLSARRQAQTHSPDPGHQQLQHGCASGSAADSALRTGFMPTYTRVPPRLSEEVSWSWGGLTVRRQR